MRLKPCPNKPNCVSTRDEPPRGLDPIPYDNDPTEVLAVLKAAADELGAARLIEETDSYLHIEFKSRVFRFTDDVEFELDTARKLIHFRSASRVGYSDLGVNRKRMLQFRETLAGRL